MPKTVRVELIRGVAGYCIAVDDVRVAGAKPWGGGRIEKTWVVLASNFEHLFPTKPKRKK